MILFSKHQPISHLKWMQFHIISLKSNCEQNLNPLSWSTISCMLWCLLLWLHHLLFSLALLGYADILAEGRINKPACHHSRAPSSWLYPSSLSILSQMLTLQQDFPVFRKTNGSYSVIDFTPFTYIHLNTSYSPPSLVCAIVCLIAWPTKTYLYIVRHHEIFQSIRDCTYGSDPIKSLRSWKFLSLSGTVAIRGTVVSLAQ
jgi:hypothetical protein